MGRKAQARDRILQAARQLFWEKGYTAVGVDEICARAAVNKGSLYHYHQDKLHLMLAVIESNSIATFDFIQEELLPLKPARRILKYFDWMMSMQINQARESGRFPGCPFGKLAAETAGHEAAIPDAVEVWFQQMLEFLGAALKELRPEPGARHIKSVAQRMLMSWQGALVLAQARNDAQPLRQCRGLTADLLRELQDH